MTGLTWLHLSDWHQGGKEFNRQVVLSALLKDIRERSKISANLEKIDFIIFSGDVALTENRISTRLQRNNYFSLFWTRAE
jgi:DNA repair exonuclease SbcCD nuclease subunit